MENKTEKTFSSKLLKKSIFTLKVLQQPMPDWQDRNPDRPELMIYVKTWSSKKLLMDRKDRKLISRSLARVQPTNKNHM